MVEVASTESRKKVIDEILGNENQMRKNGAMKRSEVYNDRAEPYVLKGMEKEFEKSTVDEMRKITSINLCKRIIDEIGSLYKKAPEREFQNANGKDLNENEKKQIENLYKFGRFDWKYKKANRSYELQKQCTIQVLPRDGIIELRVFSPHQYDVIPDPMDPEKPGAYIVSVYDRSKILAGYGSTANNFEIKNMPSSMGLGAASVSDGVNQAIADNDDYKRKQMRFVWWTKAENFLTDGLGVVLDPTTETPSSDPSAIAVNLLGELPFVDVALDKDSEFWVRHGQGVVEFDLEFAMLLMDTFFIHKMQGFAQAIIYSEKPPANMKVGPNHVMHIPLDPNKEVQPRFEFSTPNSDLNASMELIETFLRLFLSSRGIDPKTVSGKSETQRFSSGIERLLAMIDKFEASQDSIDLFLWIENQVLRLVVKWSNIFQGVTSPNGPTVPLIPELRLAKLPEDIIVTVNFTAPEVIQTKAEAEDSAIKLKENGLMSRTEAIMKLRNVTEEEAKRIASQIDSEELLNAPKEVTAPGENGNEEIKTQDKP